MRRWTGSIGPFRRRRALLPLHVCRCWQPRFQRHHLSTHTQQPGLGILRRTSLTAPRANLFDRIALPSKRPRENPQPWVALLDRALPPHLRVSDVGSSAEPLSAQDVVDVLFAAVRQSTKEKRTKKHDYSIDLLYHLGVEQGRWRAVVYLVKLLMESFPKPLSVRSRQTLWPWANDETLRQLTWAGPVYVEPPVERQQHSLKAQSLGEMTAHIPESYNADEKATRKVLGFIWSSLGHMVLAGGDEIAPEVLETLAYLHHHGWMHMSIYNSTPNPDPTAIQQPPILSLLSSRIITSLSDAAWRAHEKLVVEEAMVKGGAYASSRPEIPGSAYRVHVAGLRPEIWLELILWSCLHGGWTRDGARIMQTLAKITDGGQWRPLSWRKLVPLDTEYTHDWEGLNQAFNTRTAHADQDPNRRTLDVRRTISSELVDAYVDATINSLNGAAHGRTVQANAVLDGLVVLHDFLNRGQLTTTGSGSWDRVVSRMFDSQRNHVLHSVPALSSMAALSASFGDELQSTNYPDLPAYVLDRSSTMLGIFHLALRDSVVVQGDIGKTLSILKLLQDYTDNNKRGSIRAFFQVKSEDLTGRSLFDQNYSSIEYPAFDMQIPTSILGPLVDLLTDSREYKLVDWLISQDQVDGPIIPQHLFTDPTLLPALLRFAVEADRQDLLRTLLIAKSHEAQDNLPSVTGSFLDAQIRLKKWPAVAQVLKHIEMNRGLRWTPSSLALMIDAMLSARTRQLAGEPDADNDLISSKKLFAAMVKGGFRRQSPFRRVEDTDVFIVILSTLDPYWAEFSLSLRTITGHRFMSLTTRSFNLILAAVLRAYGSVVGRALLGKFWSHEVRRAQNSNVRTLHPSSLDREDRQRTVIYPAGSSDKKFVVYGGVKPNVYSIRLILDHVLLEVSQRRTSDGESIATELAEAARRNDQQTKSSGPNSSFLDLSTYGMLRWVVRRLQELGKDEEAIVKDLQKGLQASEIQSLEHLWSDDDELDGTIVSSEAV